ncbi:N-6 DNA methylase [Phytomonospora endophytica]|uniref:DNA methylase adenine-specific domain-containing protein n=1 Tax=Phytomonospora endophytica TaxID=714109 RepID=A0A841F7E2_9ACTN|nr:N-6 DNA methylase [Phytomonospora endophytica]MBB6032941.1 hypothetical protein [Phytomonospora endophytica]GIG65167.1 type II restriction endonuclease subunit M [Phytomonospora endophytica]
MDAVEASSADIARLANVRPTAVSNWRKRHADFPRPIGGTESSPRFDLDEVLAWLREQGKAVALPTEHALLQAVAAAAEYTGVAAALNHAVLTLLYPPAQPDPGAPGTRLLADVCQARLSFTQQHPGLLSLPEPAQLHTSEYAVIRSALALADSPDPRTIAVRLIEKTLGRRTGSHTPSAPLARLLVALASDDANAMLLDPSCGVGEVLLAAVGNAKRLAGQVGDPDAALLTALRLTLAGAAPSMMDIHAVDALRREVFGPRTARAIATVIPPNDRDWAAEGAGDRFTWPLGTPSSRDSELAWIQRTLAHLRPEGHAAVLLPAGVASRPSGRAIRRELVRTAVISAVISLPRGSVEGSAAAPQIWILQAPSTEHTTAPRPVLMVDLAERSRRDGPDWSAIETDALEAWRRFQADPEDPALTDHLRTVPAKELLDERVDFSPTRYLTISTSQRWPDEARDAARNELTALLSALNEGLSGDTRLGRADLRSAGSRELGELEADDIIRIRRRKPGAATTSGPGGKVLLPADLSDAQPPTSVSQIDDPNAPVIRPGDVLATVTTSMLHARLATDDDLGAHLGPHVVIIRTDAAILDPGYLAGYLAGEPADRQVRRSPSHGIHVAADLRRIRVPLPEIATQRELALHFRELQRLSWLAGTLERRMRTYTDATRDRLLAAGTTVAGKAG